MNGIYCLVTTERNFRKHLVFATLAVILGFLLQINLDQWLWVIFALFAVISAESLNTIVEAVVDLIVDHKYDPLAKRAKDVAAGGVLLSALFAVIIGLIVFGQALLAFIK
nr:diacylglycerol kinase family protein [Secundilactobacillus oryzae]